MKTMIAIAMMSISMSAFAGSATANPNRVNQEVSTQTTAKVIKVNGKISSKTAIASVTVAAKRMSDEQKAAFDRETRKAAKAPNRLVSN